MGIIIKTFFMSVFAKTTPSRFQHPAMTPDKPFEYYLNGGDWGDSVSFCDVGRE